MKKSLLRFVILVTVPFVLLACPYSSTVPVSEPSEDLNKGLFGKWIAASDLDYDDPTYYAIGKFDDHRYKVSEYVYSSYDGKYTETNYLMHSSAVNGEIFMNVQEVAGGDYHLHMIRPGNEEFTWFEVSDNIDEKFSSSADLKAFIEKNMIHSFFFSRGEKKFVRK